jgi:hypothetical protein
MSALQREGRGIKLRVGFRLLEPFDESRKAILGRIGWISEAAIRIT